MKYLTAKLTDEQKKELVKKLTPMVKRMIVCDKLAYVETKVFNSDEPSKFSAYHIFSAKNDKCNLANKVTYNVKENTLSFTLWETLVYEKV